MAMLEHPPTAHRRSSESTVFHGIVGAWFAGAALACAPTASLAQAAAPSASCSTTTIVTPYGPGGAMDGTARLLAQHLSKTLGQNFVVENKPGAGGVLGSQLVMRAAPDGCTLLFTNSGALVVQSVLKSPPPYDPNTAFTPITKLADAPTFIAVNASVPAKTMGELVALAKREPGKLNYASPGVGSFGHFVGEYLKLQGGVDIVHVPFTNQATNELLAGRVQLMIDPAVVPYRNDPRVRVLATTAGTRSTLYPEIPSVKESGGPDMALVGWFGLMGPARMSKEIVTKLDTAARTLFNSPEARTAFEAFGVMPAPEGPDRLAAIIKEGVPVYADIKARARISVE